MELMVNDLSICGQFPDISSFCKAIGTIMDMREIAQRFDREICCHKNISCAQVTSTLNMQQAIRHLNQAQRSALMQWLTRHGPYWEDDRVHGPNDYLECNNDTTIVTDTAIGEAAFRCLSDNDTRLVSLVPSSWEDSPISVCWHPDDVHNQTIEIVNYSTKEALETDLKSAPPVIKTWEELDKISSKRFPHLTFADDSFMPLAGYPFSPGAAGEILRRLQELERLKCCFDESGARTPEGHQLYQKHFTGDKAWFSDSSTGDKNDFKNELTFKHPDKEGETLFCTWHGKVKTPQLRIHFSWPVSRSCPLYVVYVGPKITKR